MEIVFEFLFSVVGELLLQIVIEVLIELGFHSAANALSERKKRNPYLAFIGYCLFGAIVGALSLWVIPHQVIQSEVFAIVNLFFTPIVAGTLMSLMGYIRRRKGKDVVRLDSFLYGFTFAFFIALMRYYFGA